ncbi:MAG: transposase [Bacteroidetes bacterium]|nr:transposase [Bacteroidota bacterium]MBU1485385.1 transposase [Bacteroidota bacterium]MBU1759844.1 transposase [Bacteroidota bacterium]MBU2046014.1 transposase [Bacteroidota bacterium]
MEKPRKGSKSGLPPLFEEDFKILVAREYLTGQMSHAQLARKYSLSGEHTSRYFVRWYQKWLETHQLEAQVDIPETTKDQTDKKQFEKQLFEANLKITALEMMIQVAEETLGIDIGKKSGTKSSVK